MIGEEQCRTMVSAIKTHQTRPWYHGLPGLAKPHVSVLYFICNLNKSCLYLYHNSSGLSCCGSCQVCVNKKSRQTLLTCLQWIHWCSCGVMRDALHLAREMGNQRLINLIRVLVPHSQHFLCLLYVKLHSHFNTINACSIQYHGSIQFLLQTWNESQKPTN